MHNPIHQALKGPDLTGFDVTKESLIIYLDGRPWLTGAPAHDGYSEGYYRLHAGYGVSNPCIATLQSEPSKVFRILAAAAVARPGRPEKGEIERLAGQLGQRCFMRREAK